MAEMFVNDSSERTTPEDGGRSMLNTLVSVGPHLSRSTSRHLIQPLSDVDQFTFCHSFWQAHDEVT